MTTDDKANKRRGRRVPIGEALKDLGYVKWPPKAEGEGCECGCRVEGGMLKCCRKHRPIPV